MALPNIICHMHVSVDGKIAGPFHNTDVAKESGNQYYEIGIGKNRFYSQHKGWLSGRITTDENFTNNKEPDVNEAAEVVPEGDFITNTDADMYYFSIDPSGSLGWEKNYINYHDTKAYVVEIITNKASNAYKDLLRRLEIPYLIAGTDSLDLTLATEKIAAHFSPDEILLCGGASINWSFMQAGLVDEVSLVMIPAVDGSNDTQSLFEMNKYTDNTPMTFSSVKVDKLKNDALWIRYKVNNG